MAEVILALDLPGKAALRLLDRLPDVRWVKVGSILFVQEGPPLVRELVTRGLRVFLDLKWHDIPHTVAGAVEAAREMKVALATVHSLGGAAMLHAAQQAAGPDLGLLGVTVLTSHTAEGYAAALGRESVELVREVERLAGLAGETGLRGVVCSPLEIVTARKTLGPDRWIVVPGIRPAGSATGDQARIAEPAAAARSGATHLVVGRPILEAQDPVAAFRALSLAGLGASAALP